VDELVSNSAKRLRRKPVRHVAPVIDLDDYRGEAREVIEIERIIALEERCCAAALVADWTAKLFKFEDPTRAFLATLADTIDDALEGDDLDGLRERLELMSEAARKEAARRVKS
jgi:hypothetical protein